MHCSEYVDKMLVAGIYELISQCPFAVQDIHSSSLHQSVHTTITSSYMH